MINKYSRQNFVPTVSAGDYLEKDLILNNWDLFEINRPIRFDTIHRQDLQRPDLLSLRVYSKMSYFWILLKVNMIDSVLNDMEIGQDIIVPDVEDIVDFVLAVKKRIRALNT